MLPVPAARPDAIALPLACPSFRLTQRMPDRAYRIRAAPCLGEAKPEAFAFPERPASREQFRAQACPITGKERHRTGLRERSESAYEIGVWSGITQDIVACTRGIASRGAEKENDQSILRSLSTVCRSEAVRQAQFCCRASRWSSFYGRLIALPRGVRKPVTRARPGSASHAAGRPGGSDGRRSRG